MKEKNHPLIPFYEEINDFLEAAQVKHRTSDPSVYCMRLKEVKEKIVMPPFRRGFYFTGLLTTEKNTKVEYNNTAVPIEDSFIVFQAPRLTYSFYRDPETVGYLVYFKEDCFDFFKPDFLTEFPFFNILNTNLFQFGKARFEELSPHFEMLFQSFESEGTNIKVTLHKLLALLYQLIDFAPVQKSVWLSNSAKKDLAAQFIQLVNVHYIEKKTVSEYAGLLSRSENYLSRTVKSVTGKNALSFINDRIAQEAKSLIRYTDLTFTEITFRLNFTDTSNFSKFFKKMTGRSPTEYRSSKIDRNLPD